MAYNNPKGKGWYADWRLPGSRRKRKLMPNKALAEQYEAQQKLKIMRGEVGIAYSEPVTLREFYNRYSERHSAINKKESTRSTEPFMMVSINKYLGDFRMVDITPETVEKFKAQRLKEGVRPSTVNRSLTLLSNMFNKAIEWNVINVANPLRKVKRFKENNVRVRYLSVEEISLLLDYSDGVLKDIILIALHTGMRRGEIQKLKRRDINFANNVIAIPDQKNNETSYIPMNGVCRKILSKYRDLGDDEQLFGYDFSSTFERLIYRIRKKLKEKDPACTLFQNFHFHDLRHTFASYLVMNGIDLNTVRELLRHKSIKMTLRYAHLSPGFKQAAVENLDTYWTPASKLLRDIPFVKNCKSLKFMVDKNMGGTGFEPVTPTMSR